MHTDTLLSIKAVKSLIDDYLKSYSARRIQDAEKIGPSYVQLRKAIDSLIQVGGKRFRPYMTLLAFEAYAPQKPVEPILPAAAAQEIIHLAMLIHDDIIDRDMIRYGIKNIAGQYEDFYAQYTSKEEAAHLALSVALLAGDALLSDAHQLIRSSEVSHPVLRQIEDILSASIFDVIGGELLDTETSVLPKGTISPLAVAEHKTSSYSFIGPLTTGAVLGEAPEQDVELLAEFGRNLGIAYQLCDDLLGVFGDSEKTGKSTTSDISEGKYTYLITMFEANATKVQKDAFQKLFHKKDLTGEENETVKQLLINTGAKTETETLIAHHEAQCQHIIQQLTLSDESKNAFYALMRMCLKRES